MKRRILNLLIRLLFRSQMDFIRTAFPRHEVIWQIASDHSHAPLSVDECRQPGWLERRNLLVYNQTFKSLHEAQAELEKSVRTFPNQNWWIRRSMVVQEHQLRHIAGTSILCANRTSEDTFPV